MTQAKRKPTAAEEDAIDLLKEDHAAVDALFKQFEKLARSGEDADKSGCVAQICEALTIHAKIEEEIFYPAVRAAIEEIDVMDEAEVEHEGIKRLVAELEEMSPDEDLYDAKVTVLAEYVKHHVREEEHEMFPKVKKAKVDTVRLGAQLSRQKEELKKS
jgi:hemerythrin superfamily protein